MSDDQRDQPFRYKTQLFVFCWTLILKQTDVKYILLIWYSHTFCANISLFMVTCVESRLEIQIISNMFAVNKHILNIFKLNDKTN